MKDKSNFFSNLFIYFILISSGLIGVWIIFIGPFIAYKENQNLPSSKKDLSNSKASIKKRSDEIFNSKIIEAQQKAYAENVGESLLAKIDGIANFRAEIKYDYFTGKHSCRLISQTVDPITKDIKIPLGGCDEKPLGKKRCRGKYDFYDYVQYRANDEKNIRLYDPEIFIKKRYLPAYSITSYSYFIVLPYSFFKDFQKIALRYKYSDSSMTKGDAGMRTRTSEFDTNSVLIINNLQRRCGIQKSIFKSNDLDD